MPDTGSLEKSNPGRVLHITGGMNAGGAETMIMHLYRKINRDRIQFDFISFTAEKCHYDDEIMELGGRVFYINPPVLRNIFVFIADIYRHIKLNGPYLAVHSHTLFNSGLALSAALLAGVRLRICHSHTTMDKYNKTLARKVYFLFMKLLIKLSANRRIACSKEAGRFLFGAAPERKENYHILPNAIDLKPFKLVDTNELEELKKSLQIAPDTLVIGHVGNFGSQKNHIFLVELAEYMKKRQMNFKLILIGQGSLKTQIESVVREKNLDDYVKLLGVKTNIPLFMNMFDVFVFPSLYEGLGIVLIEAQAAGTPCVISDSIPKECDMGLGLIDRVSLKDSKDEWLKAILKRLTSARLPSDITTQQILKRGYNLDNTTRALEDIYGLNV